jgi:hypothetical protein
MVSVLSNSDKEVLQNYLFVGDELAGKKQNRKENKTFLSVKIDPKTHQKSLAVVKREDINARRY